MKYKTSKGETVSLTVGEYNAIIGFVTASKATYGPLTFPSRVQARTVFNLLSKGILEVRETGYHFAKGVFPYGPRGTVKIK